MDDTLSQLVTGGVIPDAQGQRENALTLVKEMRTLIKAAEVMEIALQMATEALSNWVSACPEHADDSDREAITICDAALANYRATKGE